MKDTKVKIDLTYGEQTVKYMDDHPTLVQIKKEYQENRSLYKSLQSMKGQLRKAQRGESGSQYDGTKHALARPLYVMSVASIQTPTDIWESATAKWLDGDISLETYLNKCEDSGPKLEAIKTVEGTDILDRVNVELRRHRIDECVRLLSGERHDVSTYLRGIKAWMVPYMMFHVGVIDTNVHAAIKPVLQWNLSNIPQFHPDMTENGRNQARAKSEKWENGKIPPMHKDWIDRRVSRYNQQDDISEMWKIVNTAIREYVGIPKAAIPQVLFNIGGQKQTGDQWNRTIHAPIYEAMGRNLERFEE